MQTTYTLNKIFVQYKIYIETSCTAYENVTFEGVNF